MFKLPSLGVYAKGLIWIPRYRDKMTTAVDMRFCRDSVNSVNHTVSFQALTANLSVTLRYPSDLLHTSVFVGNQRAFVHAQINVLPFLTIKSIAIPDKNLSHLLPGTC